MEFNESVELVKTFLNSEKCIYFISGDELNVIKETLSKVVDDIKEMMENDKCDLVDKTKDVKDIIMVLIRSYLFNPINEDVTKFIKAFHMIIFNWNNNSVKDKEIDTLIQALNRYSECSFTMMESIDVMKTLINNMKDLKSWTPSSFDISKHYFDILSEEKEK